MILFPRYGISILERKKEIHYAPNFRVLFQLLRRINKYYILKLFFYFKLILTLLFNFKIGKKLNIK